MSVLCQYKDIFKFLKAKDIAIKEVITLTPDDNLKKAKELMKEKRISGIPIIDKDYKVVGIISIEDIITALEKGKINVKIKQVMTKNVKYFYEDDDLNFIIMVFKKLKYGRYPVLNKEEKLVGIITREDVLTAILNQFKSIYRHNLRREQVLSSGIDLDLKNQEYNSSRKSDFSFKIDSQKGLDFAGVGSYSLKQFLSKLGYSKDICRKIAIATYEAEVNVIIHSKSDGEIIAFIEKDSIIVKVKDYGIGIENLNLAMQEGYSTADEKIREMGFGAGMGLPNIKRYSDKLVIISHPNQGTTIEMSFFIN